MNLMRDSGSQDRPKNFAVIGTGICGLLAAALIKHRRPDSRVDVFESASEAGGLLAGHTYTEQGLAFDIGTHIFRETGESELDQLLINAMPHDQWQFFPIPKGDISGCLFNGQLQFGSHFPDLRQLPLYSQIREEIENQICSPEPLGFKASEPALEVLRRRFGHTATDKILAPIFAGLFGCGIDEQSAMSVMLTGATRVILDNEKDWNLRSIDSRYREIAGHPNQLHLPVAFQKNLTSFYPKEGGTATVIRQLVEKLKGSDVSFHMTSTITGLAQQEDACSITWRSCDGEVHCTNYDMAVWTAGLVSLARQQGANLVDFGFDRPLKHAVAHFRFDQPTQLPVYYLHAFEQEAAFFRVTNYAAFSGKPDDGRLTVEIIGEKVGEPDLLDQVLSSLKRFGISRGAPLFADLRLLGAGFPMPSTSNSDALKRLRHTTLEKSPPSLTVCGIQSKSDLFFQNEVLVDMYRKITLKEILN
jgi:hypothetical protein